MGPYGLAVEFFLLFTFSRICPYLSFYTLSLLSSIFSFISQDSYSNSSFLPSYLELPGAFSLFWMFLFFLSCFVFISRLQGSVKDITNSVFFWNFSPQIGYFLQGSCFCVYFFLSLSCWKFSSDACLAIPVCVYLRVRTKALIQVWEPGGGWWTQSLMVGWLLGLFSWGNSKSASLDLWFWAGHIPEGCFLLAASIMGRKCEKKVEVVDQRLSIQCVKNPSGPPFSVRYPSAQLCDWASVSVVFSPKNKASEFTG